MVYFEDGVYGPVARLSLVWLLVAAMLIGCAPSQPKPSQPQSTRSQMLLSGKSLLGHAVTESELPNYDLTFITPEMQAFAKNAVRRAETEYDKAKDLHVALLSSRAQGGYGLLYSAYVTEPPVATFAQRRANCLSFTLLYAALAKSVGLTVMVNEVDVPPTWDLRDKKDMVFLRHVNVKVSLIRDAARSLKHDDVVIDLEMNRYRPNYPQREINVNEVGAHFYSNRAMEYLEAGNFKEGFLHMRKAIDLNPTKSHLWSNLGALYGRANLWHESEQAYLEGLEVNPNDLTIMNNLAYLYQQTGNKMLAAKYSVLAQRHRESNPFFQFSLALSAFDEKNYDEALYYINRAIEKEKRDVRFYELAADIYEKQGAKAKLVDVRNKIKKMKPAGA